MRREHERFDQSPLTIAEVVALSHWKLAVDDSPDTCDGLRLIADHQRLPDGWSIRGGFATEPHYEGEKQTDGIRIYAIDLLCSMGSGTYTVLQIRRRHLRPPPEFVKAYGKAVGDERSTPLEEVIETFNDSVQETETSAPPLTEDEVLASILAWKRKNWKELIDKWTFVNF